MKKYLLVIIGSLLMIGSSFAQVEPPTNLKAVFQTSNNLLPVLNIKLTWTASVTPNAKYVIYEKDNSHSNSGFYKIASGVKDTSFVDYIFKTNSSYKYFVAAYVSNVLSKTSDTVEVSTAVAPPVYAQVSGKIFDDSTNGGIKNAFVQFVPTTAGLKNCNGFKTDSNGNFSSKVPVGEYVIFTSAYKYFGEYFDNQKQFTNATKIVLKENDSLSFNIGLSVYVEPKIFSLTGSVKDTSGKSLKAEVVAYSVYSNSKFHYRGSMGKTDSLGNYSLKVVQGDTVVVFAFTRDKNLMPEFYNNKVVFADADRISVSDNITNIDFVLEPKPIYNNSLSGTVKNKANEGLLSHLSMFQINDGKYLRKKIGTHSDSLGVYSFKNINPGKYILFVHAKDRYKPTFYRADGVQTTNWKEADSIIIDATSNLTNFNFTLLSPSDSGLAAIKGNVKNPNGVGEVGTMVYAYDTNNEYAGVAVTDANGNYTISELEPGTYNVSVDKVGFESPEPMLANINYSTNLTSTLSFVIKPSLTLSVSENKIVPNNFVLEQNYPNPFNPSTKINFSVPSKQKISLKIYNVLGKEIATLVNGELNSGNYSINWNAQNISSGIYFYTLSSNGFKETRKMVLMK